MNDKKESLLILGFCATMGIFLSSALSFLDSRDPNFRLNNQEKKEVRVQHESSETSVLKYKYNDENEVAGHLYFQHYHSGRDSVYIHTKSGTSWLLYDGGKFLNGHDFGKRDGLVDMVLLNNEEKDSNKFQPTWQEEIGGHVYAFEMPDGTYVRNEKDSLLFNRADKLLKEATKEVSEYLD